MSAVQPVQSAASIALPDKRADLREGIHDNLACLIRFAEIAMSYAEAGHDPGLTLAMRDIGRHMAAALVDYEELQMLRKAALNG